MERFNKVLNSSFACIADGCGFKSLQHCRHGGDAMYVNICVRSEGGQEEERRLKEVGGRMKKGKRTDLFCQWATNQNCQRMCFFYELVCRCFNETHMHQQKQQSKQSDSISPQCSCSPFLPPSTCPFHFKHQTVAMTTFNALYLWLVVYDLGWTVTIVIMVILSI